MNNFFIKIIISTVNAFVLSHIIPGIHMDNFITAFIFAIVLSILDAIIKPILILLTLPVVQLVTPQAAVQTLQPIDC